MDQLVWEGGALHHVVVLVRLPGHGELDVALELPTNVTQFALNLTVSFVHARGQEIGFVLLLLAQKSPDLEIRVVGKCYQEVETD